MFCLQGKCKAKTFPWTLLLFDCKWPYCDYLSISPCIAQLGSYVIARLQFLRLVSIQQYVDLILNSALTFVWRVETLPYTTQNVEAAVAHSEISVFN